MEKLTVTLTYSRSTKNTHRYDEQTEDITIGSLYVQKSKVRGEAPATLRVIIADALEDV